MMPKSIENRAADSFDTHEGDAALKYIESLLMSWRDISKALGRGVWLMLILMALFELIAYSKGVKVSLSGISIADTTVIQKLLPVVIAYTVLDLYRLTVRWLECDYVYYEITGRFMSKIANNDLELMIRPALPALWSIGTINSSRNELRSERFIRISTSGLLRPIVLILPLAFEAQAYYQLIGKYGFHDILVWTGLALSTGVLIVAVIYMILVLLEP
jgi:hypothetical protein